MGRRKTQEEWDSEVQELVGGEYIFTEPYVNMGTKIEVVHNTCGHMYKVKPNTFQQGRRCPKCAHKGRKLPTRAKTQEEWDEEVTELVGNEYIFIGNYLNTRTKLEVIHALCGNTYKVEPGEFLRGSRCPECSHKEGTSKHTKTQIEFDSEVWDSVGDEYTFLEPYKGNHEPIKVRHNECKRTYKVAPNDFKKGNRCRSCFFESTRKTQQEWEKQVMEQTLDEYEFLEGYKGVQVKIKYRHKACGRTHKVTPNNFINGTRCPFCQEPIGERVIAKYLDTKGIANTPQKKFPGLVRVNPLSYDFYLEEEKILIEYHGIQHYQAVEFFGGEKSFSRQKESDRIKEEYARENGYPLLIIPYTVTDRVEIEGIIGRFIGTHTQRNAESPKPKVRVKI